MAKHRTAIWITFLFLWISNLSLVHSQTCSGYVGPDSTVPRSQYATASAADVQFLFSNDNAISCYGVIDVWRFMSASNLSASCYTTTVQIWRPSPSTAGDYMLIGENTLFDTAYCNWYLDPGDENSEIPVTIPTFQRIPVEPGDAIAWKDGTTSTPLRKIGFDSGLPGSTYMAAVTVLQSANPCNPGVGNSCSWKSTNVVGRNYGLQAKVSASTNSPALINLPQSTSISELQPIGTFVYQVQANISYTSTVTVPPKLTYSITSIVPVDCTMSWFKIDPDKGNISVAVIFGLPSSVTADPLQCNLTIVVSQLNVAGLKNTSILTVNIYNVNQPPTITNLPSTIHYDVMSFSIPIFTVNAIDPDIPTFQTSLSYMIVSVEPFSSVFNITSASNTAGAITITSLLDDWTGSDEFKINVTVSDGTYVDGPKTLTVVLDNVIQSPVISNLNASIFLPENSGTGAVFTVLSVMDAKRNPINAYDIEYTITSQMAGIGVPTQTFTCGNFLPPSVNKGQGVISLNSALNYLAFQNYTIEIQATQTYKSSTLYSDPRTLTVYVTWVDFAPTLNIQPNAALLPEDTPIGSAIPLTITPTDRDVDNNLMGDYLVYFVSDADFVINNVTNIMYTTGSLFIVSGSCTEQHNFIVYVQDSFGLTDQRNVNVTVTRDNRDSPTFNQTQYNGSVSETGIGGSPTGVQVLATDPDCGPNGTVTYSIFEVVANEYFQIDPTDGNITQKQPISQPTYPNMTFTVVATDGGVPPLNSTAVVFITVIAANMHAPWFVDDYVEIETRSDAPIGTAIYTFNVTDPDNASVNNISYQIVVLQSDFDVESSGAVVPERSLQSYKRYTLYVIATDTGQGKNYFTDPATLVIDTYDAKRQLIDIKMLRPLSATDPLIQDFMTKLNNFLAPWVVKMEDLKYDGDDTVVTIYAYEATSTFSAQPTTKDFIDRDALLAKLRTSIYGTPVDGLRGPEFEDYEIVSVQPTYPVWVIDTPEGIATLTIVCLVALALIIGAIVALLKKFKLFCFKKTKVAPEPEKTEAVKSSGGEEFQLSYTKGEPYVAKHTETTISDVEPFERPPTYKANTPPLRPDAELQI